MVASINLEDVQTYDGIEGEDEGKKYFVTRQQLLKDIHSKIHEEKVVMVLPSCIALFLCFLGVCLVHERNTARQAIVNSITDDIKENANFEYDGPLMLMGFKNIDDVHSIRDIWQFFELGLWPQLLWQKTDDRVGSYLHFNQIISGARFFTQSYNETIQECKNPVAVTLKMSCLVKGKQDALSIGWDDLAVRPRGEETNAWSAGPDFDKNSEKTRRWMLYHNSSSNSSSTLEEQQQMLRTWRHQGLITRETRQVMVSVLMFNADYHLLTLTEVIFFISRTGTVWPMLRIMTMDPDLKRDPFLLFLVSLAWLFFLFFGVVYDFLTFVKLSAKVGIRDVGRHLPHGPMWYIVDLVGFACGLALIFAFLDYMRQSENIGKLLKDNLPNIQSNEAAAESLLVMIENAVHVAHWRYRVVLMLYPIQLVLRMGLAFAMQPRLSVTPQIVTEAFTDLYHFVIVLTSCIICFSMIALVIFGRELEDFSTFYRSLLTNIRMLFGDIDWESLSVISFMLASIFYLAFESCMGLILFNVLIGIIMDAYHTVLQRVGQDTLTMTQQFTQFYKTKRDIIMGKQMSLQKLWMAFFQEFGHSMFDDVVITAEDMRNIAPNLPPEQARSLLDNLIEKQKYHDRMDIGLSDISQVVTKLGTTVDRTLTLVGNALKGQDAQEDQPFAEPKADGNGSKEPWPPTRILMPERVRGGRSDIKKAAKLDLSDTHSVLQYAKRLALSENQLVVQAIDVALEHAKTLGTQPAGKSVVKSVQRDANGD